MHTTQGDDLWRQEGTALQEVTQFIAFEGRPMAFLGYAVENGTQKGIAEVGRQGRRFGETVATAALPKGAMPLHLVAAAFMQATQTCLAAHPVVIMHTQTAPVGNRNVLQKLLQLIAAVSGFPQMNKISSGIQQRHNGPCLVPEHFGRSKNDKHISLF